MSNILVTGAGGFVGGALASRFARDGHRVIGLMRSVPKFPTTFALGEFIIEFGNLTDEGLLYRILVDYEIDIIVHQAAQSIVKKAQEDPWTTYQTNVMGLVALLEACRLYHLDTRSYVGVKEIKAILVATTDKVYGNGPIPYVEGQPLEALGPYSASKVAADIIARDYARTYGLPIRLVRSANIYGPGDLDESRIIPGTIQRLLRGEPAIIYESAWGMEREFVYITDEIEAYLAILARGEDGTAYNVGSFGSVPVTQIVLHLVSRLGGAWMAKPSPAWEIDRQWMDDSRLHALGWEPKVSLDEGLDQTIMWFQNHAALGAEQSSDFDREG